MVSLDDDVENVDSIPSDDSADEGLNDEEINKRRKRFIKDVNALTGKKVKKRKKSSRNEASTEISEYTWSSGKDDSSKLSLHDLLGNVKSTKNAEVTKKLRKMENTVKPLEKPLTKPESQRVERAAAYKTTKKEISKWAPTVQKNREAEQLVFPLNQYRAPIVSTKSIARSFKPSNDLEREINEVLKGSQHVLERPNKELTAAEEEALKSFDLDDAIARRKELQKARALQSYYEAKCRRVKKIRSKKYHRVQRKAEQRALEKVDLETLSEENPELFQAEVEKAEKLRALERANLRHRNTSKWAKNLIIKGNRKTKEDQERVREQLRISREMTNNKMVSDDSDNNNSDEETVQNETDSQLNLLVNNDNSTDNPWLLTRNHQVCGDETDSDKLERNYKKIESVVNNEIESESDSNKEISDAESSGDEWNEKSTETNKVTETVNNNKSKKNKTKKNKKIRSMKLEKGTLVEKKASDDKNSRATVKSSSQNDALRFLREEDDAIVLQTQDGGESSDDDIIFDTEQRMTIQEAFANDDVIGDFIREKNDIIEKSRPKAIDLTLPGWGEWAGAGLKTSHKKRKQFTKASEKTGKRKDDNKANVVINEERNTKLAKHLVSQVPFPYSNKEEFERSIRQPIGDMWNTPSVYNKLIEPRIKTTPGEVIEPIKASKSMKKKYKKRNK